MTAAVLFGRQLHQRAGIEVAAPAPVSRLVQLRVTDRYLAALGT